MTERSLQITYRKGRPFAAYLYLSRVTRERCARTEASADDDLLRALAQNPLPEAEFVYGSSLWEPELVTLRAGGLIPIARQYPGALEFVEAHNREYPGADLGNQTAAGYAGC